jgi:hypothetical protein
VKITTKIAAGGLVGLASLFGSGIAHADSNQEKEACQLMDDPTGPQLGHAPAEYAFMLVRAKMSAENARNVMSEAAQDFCPNHIIDLPAVTPEVALIYQQPPEKPQSCRPGQRSPISAATH